MSSKLPHFLCLHAFLKQGNEMQCGWAASHSLEGAQELAKGLLAKRSEWTEVFA